jgi:hypothetical protein
LLAGIGAYAVARSDRLPELVAGLGSAGCALAVVALATRRPTLLPLALSGVGAAYTVFLALRDTSDGGAPFVAAALFCAAELAFWSVGTTVSQLVARRLGVLAAAVVATALVGSLVLTLAAETSGGVALEAAGVVAAIAVLLLIAAQAGRATR